ncbi:hypothetical protein [Campylobacter gastrosuis]|uniref:Periplasmic protein n=1 Tax=Campylobacter gastrosuis TaxID=2974576 RepID=A0ABT7HMY5_9BACT|nr:hypothetical protein [Campylobacter gastrosuis]MDL0088276.1 hypothetical protein [Campylobacter gastrosuis]
MSRHTLLAIVSVLLILVFSLGIYLYKYANANLAEIKQDTQSEQNLAKQEPNAQNTWLNKLATTSKKEYVLPVNEIYIEYARPLKTKTKTAYQLIVDKNDAYSLFCITQTLRSIEVDFTLVKDGVKSQIFLNTNDSALLQSVITKLGNFDIKTSVKEVKI